jgi:hypothetical protein
VAKDPTSAVFWGICYGTHAPVNGKRIVPSYHNRKRIERNLGVRMTLDEWRVWAGEKPKRSRPAAPETRP